MRLPKPFYKLPVRVDIERLQAEVRAIPVDAWASHPNGIAGNSSVRLISADGGENDAVDGTMRPTIHLERSPYLRQILASFGVVWSRSRLMRLAPRSTVPEHADINHHWFSRVRMHIPVVTRPEVRFHCGDSTVHMAAGEAWLFDNWRRHSVENPTDHERIHLVADTSGSASFWQFVAHADVPGTPIRTLPFDPGSDVRPLTECAAARPVMHPAEVDLLIADLRAELAPFADGPAARAQVARYAQLLDGFCRDWRQVYALHGESGDGLATYARLQESLRAASRRMSEGLIMSTNGVAAHTVLEGRVLRHLLQEQGSSPVSGHRGTVREAALPRPDRPVFIIAAPRSGSTLLFESLAVSPELYTLGGEAHWLIEQFPELRPGAPQVESNRLTDAHYTAAIERRLLASIAERARRADGATPGAGDPGFRLLEKTPKNALRIPFLKRAFPDARFIFLWRDPRENVSSIIEAWRSGRWTTYPRLDGWNGPWSLLLPPGWQTLRDKPLEEIAAYQWETSNRIALDDLAALAPADWTSVRYSELIDDPEATLRRLARFADIEFGAALAKRAGSPLPLSRYTDTPPQPDKWQRNAAAIERVLPSLTGTWARLSDLPGSGR